MILLTGASGFIGTHLHQALITSHGKDRVLAYTSIPLTERLHLLHRGYSGDSNQFADAGFPNIETIIHAGAYTPKRASDANDVEKANSNLRTTRFLLDGQLPNLRRIIYLSTVDVYGQDEVTSEASPLAPATLYGKSKLESERLVEEWAVARDLDFAVLRVGHIYGPGEEAYHKIIPATFHRILGGEPVTLFGAGTEMRSFLYIHDLTAAICNALRLAGRLAPINLVGGHRISIRELVEKIISLSGQQVVTKNVPVTDTPRSIVFDNSRVRQLLLNRETPLLEGLKVEWAHMRRLYHDAI